MCHVGILVNICGHICVQLSSPPLNLARVCVDNFEGVLYVLETSSVLKYLPLSPHRTPRIVITGNVTNHMVWGPDPIFWRPRTLGRRRCGYLSLLHAAFWSHENGSHTSKLPIHLTSAHHGHAFASRRQAWPTNIPAPASPDMDTTKPTSCLTPIRPIQPARGYYDFSKHPGIPS